MNQETLKEFQISYSLNDNFNIKNIKQKGWELFGKVITNHDFSDIFIKNNTNTKFFNVSRFMKFYNKKRNYDQINFDDVDIETCIIYFVNTIIDIYFGLDEYNVSDSLEKKFTQKKSLDQNYRYLHHYPNFVHFNENKNLIVVDNTYKLMMKNSDLDKYLSTINDKVNEFDDYLYILYSTIFENNQYYRENFVNMFLNSSSVGPVQQENKILSKNLMMLNVGYIGTLFYLRNYIFELFKTDEIYIYSKYFSECLTFKNTKDGLLIREVIGERTKNKNTSVDINYIIKYFEKGKFNTEF